MTLCLLPKQLFKLNIIYPHCIANISNITVQILTNA